MALIPHNTGVAIVTDVTTLSFPPAAGEFAYLETSRWDNITEAELQVTGKINAGAAFALADLEGFIGTLSSVSLADVEATVATNTATAGADHLFETGDGPMLATGLRALLDLETPGTNIDTVIEAIEPGTGGNSITITFADGDSNDEGTWDESGYPDLVFTFKTTVTTVADFEAAIADSEYIQVKVTGTAMNALVTTDDEFSEESLAGGCEAPPELDGVDVWIIKDDADEFLFASSLENALNEVAMDVTDTGMGEGVLVQTTEDSKRITWDSIGLLGPAFDGALDLDSNRSWRCKVEHSRAAVAYAIYADMTGADPETVSATITPVRDRV